MALFKGPRFCYTLLMSHTEPALENTKELASEEDMRRLRKVRAAKLSVASNSVLTLLKIVVGGWTGSVGILSEAAHSGTDLIASAIALYSVRAADTPPDEDHPYGHGKIESISGLAEAMLIFAAALFIGYEIIDKLRFPALTHSGSTDLGIGVMTLSMLANFFISRYLYHVAKETSSEALHADAAHLQTDVVTSAGVLAGLALVRFTRLPWLDPVAAAVVATLLVHTAYRLTRGAIQLLLDSRLPDEDELAIVAILRRDPRVLGFHKLRTRRSGAQRHADIHVQIEDTVTLVYAHQVTEEIEDAIRAALPGINITIHIEPYYDELKHQSEAHQKS